MSIVPLDNPAAAATYEATYEATRDARAATRDATVPLEVSDAPAITALKRIIANLEADAEYVPGITVEAWLLLNQSAITQAKSTMGK